MTIKALYSGSFDPMTNGHLDIITRAAKMFDQVVVGVIVNPTKNPLFSKEERKEMIEEVTSHLGNVTVECFEGLLADYVNNNNFNVVIRGLRATTDFEYEIQMAQMNAILFKENIESIFLMTSPRYSFISSSMIKEVVSLNGCVKGLVPEKILGKIKEKYLK
ncbi:MAG: pantetheine-phosphate adenylyltransferase [Anaerovoracaceae bacterium]